MVRNRARVQAARRMIALRKRRMKDSGCFGEVEIGSSRRSIVWANHSKTEPRRRARIRTVSCPLAFGPRTRPLATERLLTESHSGTLYVVASPIGNSHDLSPRALETLRTADVVLAEDTRSARKLLGGHGIDRRTQSCFDANEPARAAQAAALLRAGASIALLSEAGTPSVSDPGYRGSCTRPLRPARAWCPCPGPRPCWPRWWPPACPPIASSSWGFPRARPARAVACWLSLFRCRPRWSSSNRPIAWQPPWPSCPPCWARTAPPVLRAS